MRSYGFNRLEMRVLTGLASLEAAQSPANKAPEITVKPLTRREQKRLTAEYKKAKQKERKLKGKP